MLTTFFINGIKALTGLLVVVGGWLLVQAARRRVFGEPAPDEGASCCHGCARHGDEDISPCSQKSSRCDDFQMTPLGPEISVTLPLEPGE